MMTFVDQTGKTLREGRKPVRMSPCAQDRVSVFVVGIGLDWANDAQQSQLGAEAEEDERGGRAGTGALWMPSEPDHEVLRF